MKYIKNVLWRVAKRLSYIEDARYLKVKTEHDILDVCLSVHRCICVEKKKTN